MIISCINCNKNFDVDSDLIPEKGRLLICSSCNHQWFFQKIQKDAQISRIDEDEDKELMDNKILDKDIIPEESFDEPVINDNIHETRDIIPSEYGNDDKNHIVKENSFKTLNLILVFIISAIAIIILMDTFKSPISIIIPNIEFILYNLFESVKDIFLFFKDLL
tara:strand:- start:551 stop:1042 length:492 start_codon:yes stop_codon:yes gene_type:complete